MADFLIDTNVFSRVFTGSKAVKEFIETLPAAVRTLLADALIAATCLKRNLTLVTYNVNDFQFVQGLKYLKPPV